MKVKHVAIALTVFALMITGTISKASEYISAGPAETANIEKALYEILPGYNRGIFPRQAILDKGIKKGHRVHRIC